MRWIRLLRRRPKPTPPRPDTTTAGQRAADKALSRAQRDRRNVEAQRSAVSQIASRLARERERNHFAELFRASMEGGHR